MSLELWLGFVLASSALLIIPGPTVMLVLGQALVHGRRSAFATVPGVALGDLTALSLSCAGLGAVLAASATLFTLLKLAGVAYLFWLGLRNWQTPPPGNGVPAIPRGRSMLVEAFAVTALNPKSIVFFVAFVPQFLIPTSPLLPQLLVLIPTFVALATLNAALFALLAGSLRGSIRRPSVRLWLDRLGGAVLIGAGAWMLAWRRAHDRGNRPHPRRTASGRAAQVRAAPQLAVVGAPGECGRAQLADGPDGRAHAPPS